MVTPKRYYSLLSSFTVILIIKQANTTQIPRPRGVSISRAPLYQPGETFTCLDSSATIPYNRVNDDYCDCRDGSDEPGTAACPNGVFHCTNAGHKSIDIPSSRVNDGICDCCDTSDEYLLSGCVNTCHQLGQSARVEAQKRIELLKAGSIKRNELIQKSNGLKKERSERFEQLQQHKAEAEKLRLEKEQIKNEAEALENEALEVYRKIEEEEKRKKEEAERKEEEKEAMEQFVRLDSDQNGVLELAEIQSRALFDTDKNGEVSVEEAKYYLNDEEEVSVDDFMEKAWSRIKQVTLLEKGLFQPPQEDEEEVTPDHEDVDHHEDSEDPNTDVEDVEEDHEEEGTQEEAPSDPIKYDDETQKLIDNANQARQVYNEADRAMRELQSEMSNIEEYFDKDFGPEGEFAMLQNECFDYRDREYTYKLCPFDKAVQIPLTGGAETRLGAWANWSGQPESHKYNEMMYDHGQTCWNGPQRSTRVKVICGTENRLVNVLEPNRCEYEFHFETPAVCYEPGEIGGEDEHDEL